MALLIKLVYLLTALTVVSAHTRGAALNQDEAKLASTIRHKPAPRRLMMDYPKNLADPPKEESKEEEEDEKEDEKKEEKGKKGGGKDQNPVEGEGEDVITPTEELDCVPFDAEMQVLAASSLTDDECRTNSCSRGCCRLFDWLICDDTDVMPSLPCVCNENTRTPPESEPDAAAVEGSPTDPPTDPPVPPPEDSPFVASGRDDEEPEPSATDPPTEPPEFAKVPVSGKPDFGGAPSESCEGGSSHHNNPLFADFKKCFSASDCPQSTECCIHSFCFCGEPDDWTADCVEATIE